MLRIFIGVFVGLLLWGGFGTAEPQKVELLLVDETKTLQASILVQILAKALKDTGLFNLEAKFVDVKSSFDDPLGHNEGDKKYEMILIIPRAREEGSFRHRWIVTRPINHGMRAEVLTGIQTIKNIIHRGSSGQLQAVGVMDDLIPALFSTIFARNGWLK